MWQEGLPFNPGAPPGLPTVSDVGLDVVMRESYSGGGPGGSGLGPGSRGVLGERLSRFYPMTFAASWQMLAPPNYITPSAFRAAMYGEAIHQSKYSFNQFAFDDTSAGDRQMDEAFFGFALESAELRNSWLSLTAEPVASEPAVELVSVETDPPCTAAAHGKIHPTTPLVQDCGCYGRLWVERSATPGVGFCAHAVVINAQSRAVGVTLKFTGLPPTVTSAQRLFDQVYTVNVSEAGVLRDGLPGLSAAVYRFGCGTAPHMGADSSVVHDGGFEQVDLSNPSRFCTRGCATVPGRALYSGVGATAGWRLMHGTPYLPPVFDVQRDDFRAYIRPDTAAPYHGRHCLRLLLPATSPAILAVPLSSAVYGAEGGAETRWTLRLMARSSPAGARLSAWGGGCYSAPWAIAGDEHPDATCGPGSAQPKALGATSAPVGVGWTSLEFSFRNATLYSQNLWLNVSTDRGTGATVWLDAVSLANATPSSRSNLIEFN